MRWMDEVGRWIVVDLWLVAPSGGKWDKEFSRGTVVEIFFEPWLGWS